MLFKRIKLANYRQHHDLDKKLDGNIILVVGSNGRGKSNLIGAMQFALTGEQAGFKKDDLVSWGAADGAVELWFSHGGKDGYIVRSLGSNRAKLTYGDIEYNGITQVNDALRVLVGVDRDMARQAVFVRQGEIDEVLFTDPRARELSFQRLMGIGDAAKIHKTMGETLSTLATPVNYDEQLADGNRRRHEMHGRLSGLTAQRSQLLSGDAHPTLESMRELLGVRQTQMGLYQKAFDLVTRIANREKDSTQVELELLTIPHPDGDVAALDHEIATLNNLGQEAVRWTKTVGEFKAAGEALVALGEAPTTREAIEAQRTRYVAAKTALDQLLGQQQLYSSLHSTLLQNRVQVTECPMCGSPITDVEQLKSRLRTTIDGFKAAMTAPQIESTTALAEQTRLGSALDLHTAKFNQLMAQYQDADRRMQSMQPVTADLTTLTQQIRDLQANKQLILDTSVQRTRLSERKLLIDSDLAKLRSAMIDVERTLGLTGQTADQLTAGIANCQVLITDIVNAQTVEQQRLVTLAGVDGSVRELEKSLSALDDTLAQLEMRKAQQGGQKAALEVLTRVRDWFHHGNGPRTLAASVLDEMNQDINKFLGNFTAPFTVIPSADSFGFKVLFTDGRTTPKEGPPDATVLSGGQKVQLAVAFRFASYCMFADKLGIISLDEPTAFLDSANIGCFCSLMEQVKKLAQGMNLQVFMATHEESLMPFADTVINLNE